MARVTSNEVKEIINTSIADVSAYITPANLLVDEIEDKDVLEAALLKEIERWLAAHFVAVRDQAAGGLTNKAVGDASEGYPLSANLLGPALGSTFYGQQALALDSTGTLVSRGKSRASFKAFAFSTE